MEHNVEVNAIYAQPQKIKCCLDFAIFGWDRWDGHYGNIPKSITHGANVHPPHVIFQLRWGNDKGYEKLDMDGMMIFAGVIRRMNNLSFIQTGNKKILHTMYKLVPDLLGLTRLSHRSQTNHLVHKLSCSMTRITHDKNPRNNQATLMRTSCQVLSLHLLFVALDILLYCPPPILARANIQKAKPTMSKLIQSALVDLRDDETTTHVKW
jgi:hypothetical protein